MTEEQELIADCILRESQLSEWEVGFIESVERQVDSGHNLTSNQIEKLTSIWVRVTKNG